MGICTLMTRSPSERKGDHSDFGSFTGVSETLPHTAGYPSKYQSGFEISIPEELEDDVFVAGAKLTDGRLVTAGGRVLGVTAVEGDLEGAISSAYAKVEKISFENAYSRKDIGKRALKALSK